MKKEKMLVLKLSFQTKEWRNCKVDFYPLRFLTAAKNSIQYFACVLFLIYVFVNSSICWPWHESKQAAINRSVVRKEEGKCYFTVWFGLVICTSIKCIMLRPMTESQSCFNGLLWHMSCDIDVVKHGNMGIKSQKIRLNQQNWYSSAHTFLKLIYAQKVLKIS